MNARLSMQTRVRHFLAERRRLGFELTKTGLALRSFARYVDARDYHGPLTVEIMAEWARRDKRNSTTPITWARRLKILRPFARYLQQFEPRTEVPDESIFGPVDPRLAPHIYSEQEIIDLLSAARQLRPDLRGAGYETLFGLLAATGLRGPKRSICAMAMSIYARACSPCVAPNSPSRVKCRCIRAPFKRCHATAHCANGISNAMPRLLSLSVLAVRAWVNP